MKLWLAGLLLGAVVATSSAAAQDSRSRTGLAGQHDVSSGKAAASAIVQDYEPDPALWVLRDHDTTIYLLGTIHVLPEGFRWKGDRLDAIIAGADELIVETTEEDAAKDRLMPGVIESLAKRRPMSQRLSPDSRRKWLLIGEALGVDLEQFDRMPPLMAMIGISTAEGAEETGSTSQFGVETVLEAEFRAAGKPIGAIESAAGVMTALLTIDDSLLIKELDRELSRWDGKSVDALFGMAAAKGEVPADTDADPLAQEHAWAQGSELDIRDVLFGDMPFTQIMGKRLLDNRNRAWAEWLENRLARPGTVLVAVGAGHLAGHNSLQAMLSARGLSAKRLN